MPTSITSPVNIAPVSTPGVWASVDVTAHVAQYAGNVSGAILLVINTDPTVLRRFGVRKNGSTDTHTQELWIENSVYQYIGVDANNMIGIWIAHATVEVYLVGVYTMDEAVFFANAIDKGIIVPSSWETISIAADVGTDIPLVAFLRIDSNGQAGNNVGVRAIGSTDTELSILAYAHGVVVKVDSAKDFQLYLSNVLFSVKLLGYQTVGANMLTNKLDYSTGTIDAWDVVAYNPPAPRERTTGVYFHHLNATTSFQRIGAHRPYGSGFEKLYKHDKQVWGWSGIDSSWRGEQYINNSEMDLKLIGYTEESPVIALPYTGRALSGGAQQFNGGLL